MYKFKRLALSFGAFLFATLATGSFVSADKLSPQLSSKNAKIIANAVPAADCKRMSAANPSGQDIFLSTGTPNIYTGPAWQIVDCTNTTFRLDPGQRALVVGTFSAEADCNGLDPENGEWCQTRALIHGTNMPATEGEPVALEPSSFAFDSVAGGSGNLQAHTMPRAWEITCLSTAQCTYRYRVEVRNHDTSITGLWLDEIAAHIDIKYGAPASP
jgi:hypothetical protein